MPTMIDHVVVVVRDLAAAAADAAAAGFTVTPGGEHAGGATHNALIPFQDGSYIELIAFRAPDEPQPHKWWPRLRKGEGLVDFALLSADLAAEAQQISARGLPTPDPAESGRLRPDGERLSWRAVQTQERVGETGLPFIIEDVTARPLRVPDAADATTHRTGATGIAGVTVAVADLGEAAPRFAHLLGTPVQPSAPKNGGRHAALFPVGSQWIQLRQPATARSGTEAGETDEDALLRDLMRFGDGPFEVILRTGDPHNPAPGPAAGDLLDPRLMHDARFRLAR